MAKHIRFIIMAGVTLWLGCSSVRAQITSALSGTVTDSSGAVVRDADVKLVNPSIAGARTTKTGPSGIYVFPQLPPATYRLEVSAKGFKTVVRNQVTVQVGLTSTLDLQLAVGRADQVVEVQAEAAPINTQDASLGTPFNRIQITQLPLEGRSIVGLLSLQTGAVYLPTQDMRSGSINGGRSDQANISLDGVDANDPENQTVAYESSLRMPLDSVAEFRTTTTNYGAELGRSSGAQVQIVTKSGTNQLHGSAYFFDRDTAFSSNEFFNNLVGEKTPKLNKQVSGASAGGPIVKNRLFIFGNFEALRESSESPVLRSVPSASLRDGVILYQCADPTLCPGGAVSGLTGRHAVPAGYFGLTPAQLAAIDPKGVGPDPAVVNHFNQYPTPNDPGLDVVNVAGFRFNAPVNDSFNTGVSRIDYKINSSGTHSLFWRGNLQHDTLNDVPQFPGQPPNSATKITNKGMVLGYDAVLRTNLLNSFRWGFTRIEEVTQGVQTQSQISFLNLDDLPAKTATSGRRIPTHDFRDDITWAKGRHTWQFGTDIRFTRIPRFSNASSFSSVLTDITWGTNLGRTFTPGQSTCTTPGCSSVPAVAGTFVSAFDYSQGDLMGLLIRGAGNYNYTRSGALLPNGTSVQRRFGSDEYEWYAQDTWRLRPSLTMMFGVRYSLFSPPWETNGLQVCPTPGWSDVFKARQNGAERGIPSNEAVPSISFDLCGPANHRQNFYPWSTKNFAPRISLAWNPRYESGMLGHLFGNGKTVLRGGYGLVYDRVGQALARAYDSNGGAFGLSASLSAPFGILDATNAPRFTTLNALPGEPAIPAAPAGGFPITPAADQFIVTNSIDDGIVTPYSHLVDFTVGRELKTNLSLEASYVGRLGRRLLSRRDVAQQVNLVDPKSGMDYYTAADILARDAAIGDPTGLTQGLNTAQVAPIPYWQDLYANAAGHPVCDVDGLGASATATQVVYDAFKCVHGDYSTALALLDAGFLCQTSGTCSKFGPYAFFLSQFCCNAAQSSVGFSNYHSLQVTLRERGTRGLQFTFNYTLSKSLDLTSDVERGSPEGGTFSNGFGIDSYIVDAWFPQHQYSQSDFDVRHQFNANWLYQLPFGRGKALGSNVPRWMNHILGGWQLSGIFRLTSGFPFNVVGCFCFPTNQTLIGNAELLPGSSLPSTSTTLNAVQGFPSPFADPQDAINHFRPAIPGEVGLRNVLRGDGYFSIDAGLGKTIFLPWKEQTLQFRWETFNVTNTPKFDSASVNAAMYTPDTFGRYTGTLATCDARAGRCMQLSLRYEF
ncbi:MAG TPA: carboxypeptidase regulatory-like domain-containing protein [Terriglobales bacterium]|nr:carboxypeptidase regulatory-like domain-containing protein [Terriglobales bacterium]